MAVGGRYLQDGELTNRQKRGNECETVVYMASEHTTLIRNTVSRVSDGDRQGQVE